MNSNRVSTIKEQVYNIIKSDILNGIIKSGEKLQEKDISKSLNVSRSPVREALKELVGEGLVENVPNKGTFVKKLEEKEIIDLFELRVILEQYAMRKTVEEASNEDLKELDEIYERLEGSHSKDDLNEYIKIDTELHNMFFRLSGNLTILNLVENITTLLQPFRVMSLFDRKRFNDSLIEHKNMIDGLKEKDYEKAWQYNSLHLRLAKEEVIRQIHKVTKQCNKCDLKS